MLPARGPRLEGWYERLTLFRAVRTILAIATLLVLAGGALARIVEPDTFTSLGLAYWWALETVTTVGYGTSCRRTRRGASSAACSCSPG